MVKSWNAHYLCAILGCYEEFNTHSEYVGCRRCRTTEYSARHVYFGEHLLWPLEERLRWAASRFKWLMASPPIRKCNGGCGTILRGQEWNCGISNCDWIPF